MYVKSFPFKLRYFAHLAKFAYWILRRRLLFKRWSDGGQGLRLDDGSQLSLKDQLLITKAFWKNAVVLPWQKGDILILDNRLVAHGRMPHEGQRKVLFCMNLPSFIDEESATQ